MTTRELDRLARGQNPRDRVAVPAVGERCPRCHQRVTKGQSRPCLLCCPELVPVAFGGLLLHDPDAHPDQLAGELHEPGRDP